MNRRQVFGGLLGFFGIGATAKAAQPNIEPGSKGFIVYYINVGTMPPKHATAYCARLMDQMVKERDEYGKLPGWAMIIRPVREESRTEIFAFTGENVIDKVEPLQVPYKQDLLKDTPELRQLAMDHVKMASGKYDLVVPEKLFDGAVKTVLAAMETSYNGGNDRNMLLSDAYFFQEGVFAMVNLGMAKLPLQNTHSPSCKEQYVFKKASKGLSRWRKRCFGK